MLIIDSKHGEIHVCIVRLPVRHSGNPEDWIIWMTSIKIVATGDGAVGKSCLLITYVTGEFPLVCTPTVFDTFEANIVVDGQQCSLRFWDTAGTRVVAGEGLTVYETLFFLQDTKTLID